MFLGYPLFGYHTEFATYGFMVLGWAEFCATATLMFVRTVFEIVVTVWKLLISYWPIFWEKVI